MNQTKSKYYHINGIDFNDVFMLSIIQAEKSQQSEKHEQAALVSKGRYLINYLYNGIKNRIKIIRNNIIETYLTLLNPTLHKTEYILFATEPTEVKQLEVLEKRIRESGNTVVFTTDRVNIWLTLRNKKIKTYFLRKNKKKFFETARISNQQAELSGTESVVKINFMQEHLALYLSLASKFRELLQLTSPKHVFVGYDLTQEGRLFTILCKQKNIPTYAIQHGLISDDAIHCYHMVDKYFVYGEISQNNLIRAGMKLENICISGAPYLETTIINNSNLNRALKLYSKKISGFYLVCTSGHGHKTSLSHHKKQIDVFEETFKQIPESFFIIKLHRKDKKEFYESIRKLKNVLIISKDDTRFPEDIFQYLNECLCLITTTSSTASEALYLNKPVITIDLINEYRDTDFIEAGCTLHTRNSKELISQIQLINGGGYNLMKSKQDIIKKFIERYFAKGSQLPSQYILNNLNS